MPVSFKKLMLCWSDACMYMPKRTGSSFLSACCIALTNSLINKYSPYCLWLLEINIPGIVHSALEPVGTFELPKPYHTEVLVTLQNALT